MKERKALKKYANAKCIKIIGDIPIYVAFDSADTWADPKLFQFDENGYPTAVAGCPPDGFSATGQLWGNPLYDWDYHKKTGYKWWIRRFRHCFELYDVVRVDHFRAFDAYYAIPYGDKTAEFGKWKKGPGYELFREIKSQLGEVDIIAEDLGFHTESVIKLVQRTGYPGMKVLQFAFDSRSDSDYLPHNYVSNTICYTGTHDNETTVGWFKGLKASDRRMALSYINRKTFESNRDLAFSFVKLAMGSVSKLCIIPMQDWLGLGDEARINTPSTLGVFITYSIEKLKKIGVPFVLSTIPLSEDSDGYYSSVSVDDVEESRKIVDYLIRKGHKRIAFLGAADTDTSIGKLRLDGYLKALCDAGIKPDPKLIWHSDESFDTYSMQNGYEMMKSKLRRKPDYTAVFAIADTLAIGALKALREKGFVFLMTYLL